MVGFYLLFVCRDDYRESNETPDRLPHDALLGFARQRLGVAGGGQFLSGSWFNSLCINGSKILPVLCGREMRVLGIGKACITSSGAGGSAAGGC